MQMQSHNPTLGADVFVGERRARGAGGARMTVNGTIHKVAISLMLCLSAAVIPWHLFQSRPGLVNPMLIGGSVVGLVLALVCTFKRPWAPVITPLYAIAEGFVLGALSIFMETRYPGIAFQAFALTMCTAGVMLVSYKLRLIRVTQRFRSVLVMATMGIMLVYLLSFVLGLFGVSIPYIHGSGLIGIGFSLFVVGLAALNLLLDFDLIERGARAGAPKYMEWYGAFALLVTLVWLYIEILRLLAKLADRR